MKFSNFLILEDAGCSETNCESGTKQICASSLACADKKNSTDWIVCSEINRSTRVEEYKWYCKKKKPEPNPVTPNPTPEGECPTDQTDFVKYIWILNNWVDPAGSQTPDTLKHQTRACGVNNANKAFTCDFNTASTMRCGEGMKAIWKEKKAEYETWKKTQQNVIQTTTTTTTVKPIDPEVQKFRVKFDTKFGSLVDKFTLNQRQWNRMYDSMPETYPPTSFSVFQDITAKIVDYISKYYRSKEFGLFVNVLDAFVDLYGDKKDEKGNLIEDKSKILDPLFFERFGGTIEDVKTLSKNIVDKNNEMKISSNFDSLSNPETELKYLFQEVIVTVLETPQSYFTEPLQMKASRYTKSEIIQNIDLSPINQVLSGNVNQQNCLKVLDVNGKYSSNPQIPEKLKLSIRQMGQKCLCDNFYKDLGKLSIKDKFDKEKRNLAKRRMASLNSMGIYMSKC